MERPSTNVGLIVDFREICMGMFLYIDVKR